MIGFQKIIGGTPSSVEAMGKHLWNNTLSPEQSRLAEYYRRGMVGDPLTELAQRVSDQTMGFSEALDILISQHIASGGDIDRIDDVEDRLSMRLSDKAFKIAEGMDTAPLGILRPDINPIVARGLGIDLDRDLTTGEINALIAGRRTDGELIEGKKYSKRREMPSDPRTGERKFSDPIGSYDFCPTPDKSVSVAWAFAPEVEQAKLYNAHIEAAREAVAYIAEEVGRARIGDGGEDGSVLGHVAWVEFTHHTSRRTMVTVDEHGVTNVDPDKGAKADPDLHTHFIMPNAVFCDDGRIGSLDTAALRGFIFEADGVYHARLGQKLRDAGFEVELDERTGAARMTAVPDGIRTLFSKRTNAGEAMARQYTAGRNEVWDDLTDDQRAARIKAATQGLDQKIKGGKDEVADFDDWKRQASQMGWEPMSLQLYGPQLERSVGEERTRKAYETALPWLDDKLQQKAVITQFEPRIAALRGLVAHGMDDIDDIGRVTQTMWKQGVRQYGEITEMVYGKEPGARHVSITTGLHEKEENEFVQLARAAAADKSGGIPSLLIQRTMLEAKGLDFTDEHGQSQKRVIETLAAGGRFSVAVGTAGSGKTTMLKPMVPAWKEQGREVWGASLGWRQTDDLAGAGIEKKSLKAFSVLMDGLKAEDFMRSLGWTEKQKNEAEGPPRVILNRNSVVVVDELGLLGTRQGLELLRYRKQYDFTIVALGDDKQCQSIEAGAIIDLSRRALGAEQVPEILTTKRQKTEREMEIVGLFRDGEPRKALDMKRSDGSAEMVLGGREGVIKRVAKLYMERLRDTGMQPIISAPTNTDAHQIGEAVRQARRDAGMVGPDSQSVRATDGERQYMLKIAEGDRLRLFSSTRAQMENGRVRSIGRNGHVMDVMKINDQGMLLKNTKTNAVGAVEWGSLKKKSGRIMLAYGDAMTIHTAQGADKRDAILALPSGSPAVTGNQAFVGLTRHFQKSFIVTNDFAEHLAVRESRALNDPHEITSDDKWSNVAKNFIPGAKKDSALAMLEKVGQVRRGTIRDFHQAIQPASHDRQRGSHFARAHVQARRMHAGMQVAVQRSMQMSQELYRGISRGMGM